MIKRLNEKGFTLMEVLTVIVVITALMMITIPLIGSITEKNQKELYHSYERMMEEYAIASNIKDKDKIMLSELDGLKEIKKECEGYVSVTNNPRNYHAYIKCGDKYESDVSEDNVDEPTSNGTIESCPGCVFTFYETWLYTTWNTHNLAPTVLNKKLYDNYEELIATTGKNYFLGLKINENKEVINGYLCGVKDDVPFCLEGGNGSDMARYTMNRNLLVSNNLYGDTCDEEVSTPPAGAEYNYDDFVETYYLDCGSINDPESIFANVDSDGYISLGTDQNHECSMSPSGNIKCY